MKDLYEGNDDVVVGLQWLTAVVLRILRVKRKKDQKHLHRT
jgi:hypothetical protein